MFSLTKLNCVTVFYVLCLCFFVNIDHVLCLISGDLDINAHDHAHCKHEHPKEDDVSIFWQFIVFFWHVDINLGLDQNNRFEVMFLCIHLIDRVVYAEAIE